MKRFLENVEADKGKLNIVREAGHFERTAFMQGEIVSIPDKVNDIQQIVPNTTQLSIISNFAEGNQMTWTVIHWVIDSTRENTEHIIDYKNISRTVSLLDILIKKRLRSL